MARGRFISNSISTSKKFARLASNDHRLAYIMLVPHVDAEGRHDADTRILAGQVYTLLDLTHDQIEAALSDMHRVGLIHLYTVEGERYLEVINFHEHNKVRRREDGTPSHEAPSTIPAPSGDAHMAGATTEQLQSDYVAPTAQVEVKAQVQVQAQEPRAHAREASALDQGTKQNPKKGRSPTFDPLTITLPDFVSPDVWRDFVDHRNALRRQLTPQAVKAILEDLAKTPLDADTMLRQTIARGWTGVFPLDRARDDPQPPSRPKPKTAEGDWAEVLHMHKRGRWDASGLSEAGRAALEAIGGWTAIYADDPTELERARREFLAAHAPPKETPTPS